MNNIPELIVMVGLPASGKSTYSTHMSRLYNANIHSSDKIREEFLGSVDDQSNNSGVFDVLHHRIIKDLQKGKSVIWDSTNLNSKKRMAFINRLNEKKIACNKLCKVMATPYEDCIKRNVDRIRIVPSNVMSRMYKSFEMPSTYEGFDSVEIIYSEFKKSKYDFALEIEDMKNIDHDNPHHEHSIGNHCIAVRDVMMELLEKSNIQCNNSRKCVLIMASLLHDIGKPFSKEFLDSKRQVGDIAHYYNHENVGAYDSMFYLYNGLPEESVMKAVLLINHHMKPYDWSRSENQKSRIKYMDVYGQEMYEDLMLLHRCDVESH